MNYPYSATEGKATKAKQDVFFVSFLLSSSKGRFCFLSHFHKLHTMPVFSLRSHIISENRVFFCLILLKSETRVFSSSLSEAARYADLHKCLRGISRAAADCAASVARWR